MDTLLSQSSIDDTQPWHQSPRASPFAALALRPVLSLRLATFAYYHVKSTRANMSKGLPFSDSVTGDRSVAMWPCPTMMRILHRTRPHIRQGAIEDLHGFPVFWEESPRAKAYSCIQMGMEERVRCLLQAPHDYWVVIACNPERSTAR
jgi:hypothetical protein